VGRTVIVCRHDGNPPTNRPSAHGGGAVMVMRGISTTCVDASDEGAGCVVIKWPRTFTHPFDEDIGKETCYMINSILYFCRLGAGCVVVKWPRTFTHPVDEDIGKKTCSMMNPILHFCRPGEGCVVI
jgi:hypothetical protein